MNFPTIYLILIFSLGIIFNFYFDVSPFTILAVTATALLFFIWTYFLAKKDFFQKNYFGISTSILVFLTGVLSHTLHSDKNYQTHYSRFPEKESNLIVGTISERLKPNTYSEKYYLKITGLNNQKVFGKLLLNVSKKEIKKHLKAGDKLLISDNFQAISHSVNPYQFDYATYLEKQQVYHQLYLKKNNFKIIGQEQNFDYYTEKYRNILLKSFELHQYPETVSNIINALLLGQRQDMEAITTQQYTNVGVIHILAISGLHIAILFSLLTILLKPLQKLPKGKLLQFLLSLLFLWAFAILSGLSASVVRSVVMFSFMSWGLYLNKSANIYNTMAVSMLVILLFKPNFLFDVGFQLSYAAVFSIVWLQPVFKIQKKSKYKIINYLNELLLISLIAQIGVLPISLYYFNQFPMLFLLANIVVIPLSSFVLLYGILILALNFIWPAASLIMGKLLSLSIELMNDYIGWIASYESFTLKNISFSFGLLIVSYLLLICIIRFLYQKNGSRFIMVLGSCLAFQIVLLFTFWQLNNKQEFLILNNRKTSLLVEKKAKTLIVYSNDSLLLSNQNLIAYRRGNFNPKTIVQPLENTMFYNGKSILILDSIGIYGTKMKPDIIVISQSPKINLNRLIAEIKPKQIIADGTNYKTFIKRWKTTCEKEKIPFHATAEKGFYKIE